MRNPGNQEEIFAFLVSWIPYRSFGFRAFAFPREKSLPPQPSASEECIRDEIHPQHPAGDDRLRTALVRVHAPQRAEYTGERQFR
jgi:hypothetical protein